MSILPLLQNNSPIKEMPLSRDLGFPAREIKTSFPAAAQAGPADQDRSLSGAEETASSFRKIFQEKKAERDERDAERKTSEKISAEKAVIDKKNASDAAGKETGAPVARHGERLGRQAAAAKEHASARETKKPGTLKNILSSLIENKVGEEKEGRKKSDKKTDAVPAALQGERLLTLKDRLEKSVKKEHETASVQSLLNRPAREPGGKTAVVIDLREPGREKEKSPPVTARKTVRKEGEKEAPAARDAKKAADPKEAVDVRMYAKSTAATDAAGGPRREGVGEPADVRADFPARLADAVRHEMVKHTGIVLKEGGQGEIHLLLKPESLGAVRVKLNLEDNHIVGKIIVDNNTVKEVVEDNLANLETALKEKGYESAALNVFVAGERNDPAAGERDFSALLETGRTDDVPAFSEYGTGGATIYDDGLVNIVL